MPSLPPPDGCLRFVGGPLWGVWVALRVLWCRDHGSFKVLGCGRLGDRVDLRGPFDGMLAVLCSSPSIFAPVTALPVVIQVKRDSEHVPSVTEPIWMASTVSIAKMGAFLHHRVSAALDPPC